MPARTAISTPRTAATNRVAVRKMTHSVLFTEGASQSVYTDGTLFTNRVATSNKLSVSAWICPAANPVTNRNFVAKRDNSSPYYVFSCMYTTERKIRFTVYKEGGGSAQAQSPLEQQPLKWVHFVGVCDGSTVKCYINGLLVAESAFSATIRNINDSLRLGSLNGSGAFGGRITDVNFFDEALTDNQVKSVYNGVLPVNAVGSYLRNPSTDGSGSSVIDASGNGNNGTIVSASWSTDVPVKQRPLLRDYIGSLYFDGVDDVVDCGTDFLGTGDDTLSFVLRPVSAGESNEGRIFTNGTFLAYFNSTRNLCVSSDGSTVATSTKAFNFSQWYEITLLRYSTGLCDLFVNGVLVQRGLSTGTPGAASSNVLIGDRSESDRCLNAYLSRVRVYSQALTNDEIFNLYLYNTTPYDTDPAILALNLGFRNELVSGSSWRDQSGNARHGTITNAVLTLETPSKARGLVST